MQIEKFRRTKDLDQSGKNHIYSELDFNLENKKLISFCLIQFNIENNKKKQIVRIDTAHGKPHIHKFYTKNTIIEIFGEHINPQTYEKAKQYIYSNWKIFLDKYKRKDLK